MAFRIIRINPLTPLHSDVRNRSFGIWCSIYAFTRICLCYSSQTVGLNSGSPAHTLALGLLSASDFTQWTKHTVESTRQKKRGELKHYKMLLDRFTHWIEHTQKITNLTSLVPLCESESNVLIAGILNLKIFLSCPNIPTTLFPQKAPGAAEVK